MARIAQPAQAEAAEYGHDVPTLLLIESGGAVRELLEAAPGMLQVKHAASLAEGLAMLVTEPPRAVLLDLSLPQARALTAIDEVRHIAPTAAASSSRCSWSASAPRSRSTRSATR